jgi:hypothetical protein
MALYKSIGLELARQRSNWKISRELRRFKKSVLYCFDGRDAVANKDYIERLMLLIFHLHKSGSKHAGPVSVEEIFHGKTSLKGRR